MKHLINISCVIVLFCVVESIFSENEHEFQSPLFNRKFHNARIVPRAVNEISTQNNISERCISNSITPVTCPEVLPEDNLLPHPDDCQLFYYCITPQLPPICRDCPANLHFNPVKKVCDHPDVAGCQTLIAANSPVEISLNLDQAKGGPVECVSTNGVFADLKPDPTNCTQYYTCDWGYPILMYCPDGLHFNPILLVCDFPANAQCQVNNTNIYP